MCALIVRNDKGVDVLFMDKDGKVPVLDYYRDAYEFARVNKMEAIAYEFRSLGHAQAMFGNIFKEGEYDAGADTTGEAENHCRRQHCDYGCLAA